jgi:soluble lytic murein transglycosylase-like protein
VVLTDRPGLLIIAGATLAAAFLIVQWANGQAAAQQIDPETGDTYTTETPTFIDDLMSTTRTALGLWRPPEKYAAMIAAAESENGLPADMLARLLWQESRYREDIITGRVRSPVGALGIAQFMPATAREMGIDPLNPAQAIPAAGRYLARLYRMFGSWSEALAAYNWGMGNVQRRGLDAAPSETRAYYQNILADVNAANGTNWA